MVQNRCEDYPDLVQYNFVSPEIIDTKWEEEINHIDFRVSSVAWWWGSKALKSFRVRLLTLNGVLHNTLLLSLISTYSSVKEKKEQADPTEDVACSPSESNNWLHAFSSSSLPAAPSRPMTTMRCLTRRGCWLPKCTRVTSHTSSTAY